MAWDDDDRDAPQLMDLDPQDVEWETVECPDCGQSILEDAPRCPHCGQWLIDDTPAARRARGWLWPMIVSAIVAIILVIWNGRRR